MINYISDGSRSCLASLILLGGSLPQPHQPRHTSRLEGIAHSDADDDDVNDDDDDDDDKAKGGCLKQDRPRHFPSQPSQPWSNREAILICIFPTFIINLCTVIMNHDEGSQLGAEAK